MNKIREIQRLNKHVLEQGIKPSASWHLDYRHTAYVYVGGLPFELTEGDVVTIFSQYGEPTFVKLARDKSTGKSRGFGWVKYEDQRSCDLAVDNLSGAKVLGRMISVDHTEYKKRDDEEEDEATQAANAALAAPSRADRDVTPRAERKQRPILKEEIELNKLLAEHDDEDPMKQYYIDQKKEEVAEAIKRYDQKEEKRERGDEKERRHRTDDSREKPRRRHRSRSRSDDGDRHDRRRVRRHGGDEGRGFEREDRDGEDRHVKREERDDYSRRRRSRSRDDDRERRDRRQERRKESPPRRGRDASVDRPRKRRDRRSYSRSP